MLDVEKVMKLTKPNELRRACHEAEHSNCEQKVIRELYRLYYVALEKEERRRLGRLRKIK